MRKFLIFVFSIIILTSCKSQSGESDKMTVNLDEFYNTKPIPTYIQSVDFVTSKNLTEKVSKTYNSLDELEKDLRLNFLHSSFFNQSDYDTIYFNDDYFSKIYLFKEDINPYYFGVINLGNDRSLILEISWNNNSNETPYSVELMGGCEIIENYDINSTNISIIKESRGKKVFYSGIFKFNDMTYFIKNSEDLDTLKNIIQDLLNLKKD
ncbi:MAG: hypothetical protein E6Z55_00955 [Peptoniphilus harei]|nr:hypothetical protein [Peptoniphilus harei]